MKLGSEVRWGLCTAVQVAALLSLASCNGNISGKDNAHEGDPSWDEVSTLLSDGPPEPNRALTRFEYANCVKDLGLMSDMTSIIATFPEENSVDGYKSQIENHGLTFANVDAFWRASEQISAQAVVNATWITDHINDCTAAEQDRIVCAENFAKQFLPKVFRRPVEDSEYEAVTQLAEVAVSRAQAISLVIQMALQSPSFLYKMEDIAETSEAAGAGDIGAHDLANRLSFTLWGSMPDEELRALAEDGSLQDPDVYHEQALRLINSPKAQAQVREFTSQWLKLDRWVSSASMKTTDVYADFDASLPEKWRNSVLDFLAYAFFEKSNIKDLYTDNIVFGPAEFETIYGISMDPETQRGQSDPDRYAGLLAQPAFTALLSSNTTTSPVHRGLFVLDRVICQEIPPPDIIPAFPEDSGEAKTTRQRFEQHSSDPACAGCHNKIDPIGFAFENYDPMGKFRTEENLSGTVLPIDASGTLDAFNDPTLKGDFNGLLGDNGLVKKIGSSERIQSCFARHWMRFVYGRQTHAESQSVARVTQGFSQAEGDLLQLLVAIVSDPSFRKRAVEVPGGQP